MALRVIEENRYLNNIVEQGQGRIMRLVRARLDFGNCRSAQRTLAGYEVMAQIKNGQVQGTDGHGIQAQAACCCGHLQPMTIFATEPKNSSALLLEKVARQPSD